MTAEIADPFITRQVDHRGLNDVQWTTFANDPRNDKWVAALTKFGHEHGRDLRVLLAEHVTEDQQRIADLAEAIEHMRGVVVKQAAEIRSFKATTE